MITPRDPAPAHPPEVDSESPGASDGGAGAELGGTLEPFGQVLARLTADGPDRGVLRVVLLELQELLDCERIFLFRMRRSGGFQVLASSNRDLETISEPHSRLSHYAVKKTAVTGRALHVADARRDRRYRAEESLEGRRTAWSITVLPLCAGGEVLGGVYADHRFRAMVAPPDDARVGVWIRLAELVLGLRERDRSVARRRRELERRLEEVPAVLEPPLSSVVREHAATWVRETPEAEDFHGFLAASTVLRDAFSSLRRLAESDIPVLITGDTGTGKGLLARAVHESSQRAGQEYAVFHCGSVPESLIDSELHGHLRGAFTGAESDREGLLVQADGGTLVLDDVGEMGDGMQTRLLRVLEDGLVRPIGARETVRVDVRVVAVTKTRLEDLVSAGEFRRDLFYRLKGFQIDVPPLRERPEDILPLSDACLARAAREAGRAPPRLSVDARRRLLEHTWPGNVRELENEMRRVVALGGEEVAASELQLSRRAQAAAAGFAAGRSSLGAKTTGTLDDVVGRAERAAVEKALVSAGGNRSRAAADLGITRKSLYRRIRKYGLEES